MLDPLDPPGSGRPNGHFASNGLPDPSGSSGSSIFSSPQKKMPNALGLPGSGRPNGHFAGNGLPDPGGLSGLGIFSSPQNAQLCLQVFAAFPHLY